MRFYADGDWRVVLVAARWRSILGPMRYARARRVVARGRSLGLRAYLIERG